MKIEDMNDVEIKATIYDNLVEIQNLQRTNLQLEQEIIKRINKTENDGSANKKRIA